MRLFAEDEMIFTEQISMTLPFWGWIILAILEWTGLGLFIVGIAITIAKILNLINKFVVNDYKWMK